jgi:hypothetical protein
MLMNSDGRVAVGRGKSEPSGLIMHALIMRWQVAQVLQQCVTVLRIRGYQKHFRNIEQGSVWLGLNLICYPLKVVGSIKADINREGRVVICRI